MPHADPIRRVEYKRQYNIKNKKKIAEKCRRYFLNNKDKIYAYKNKLYSTKVGKQLKLKYFRSYYKKNKIKIVQRQRSWFKTNTGRKYNQLKTLRMKLKFPEKYRARQLLGKAIFSGKIKKKLCEYPGCRKRKVEGHHSDYSKPLDVIWYCNYHHRLIEGRVIHDGRKR